ncbi:hypothetical protein LAV84_18305 [Rhizobium sp. VS19-DR104.2]|uniref:structural cement protein Gp24 n=1 Tax=unclassified Rhizobium TaxID=2613769 RepID=UPI00193C9229|nr:MULTISPECIES: hypothetical protein [unclassified Rhizobium]MBZ5761579.1 hypothetical protein [Rhizobium sp. VS19-DR96]MBZ5767527.1 hypothetical protein [Rhizobium sp. VS19-DR129.2]MBZ5775023.1 hypothetical protein [Rhizobium sp. VS19-DRK62.2]MBZ5786010.1 hypothetical protein [Rhizobium sp. VS19-DR121]MBZ5803438.1 hypothetical protein [Rhizobium sp. VS19-DR181]
MSTYQTSYSSAPAKGLPGQVANEERSNRISRTVETAAGIAFGQPAFRGAGDHGVIAGAAFAATGTASAAAGNTGTSTVSAPVITAGAKSGRYQAVLQATSATAQFQVFDPEGLMIGVGKVGTAFSAGGVAFTITAGGTPTVGDTYYIDVVFTSNGIFVGLAILSPAVPPVANGATLVDGYPQYFTGAFMTEGQMYVVAGAAVNDGDRVYWNPATGRYTNTSTHVRIPNAVFDTTGVDGGIVEISIRNR